MVDNSQTAFPASPTCTDGMSLRDWFAGQALAASDWSNWDERVADADVAARCFELADAMLAERAKEPVK